MWTIPFNILKDSPKAIADAKKQRDIKKTIIILVEAALIFAVSSGVLVAKNGLFDYVLLSSMGSVFFGILVTGLLFALVLHVGVITIGGKGKFFEGLTSIAYALIPAGVGVLIAALLTLIPLSAGVQLVVLAVGFSLALGTLYRGVKELYSTDMLVSFIAVSIALLALIIAVYASVGLTIIGSSAV